jgi:site-specific recombinase XerD
MSPEISAFKAYLTRRNGPSETNFHYPNDLKLIQHWSGKPTVALTMRDVDAYIDDERTRGRAASTIRRRLAALRAYFDFLAVTQDVAPPCPVHPRRHRIKLPVRLPRDVDDVTVGKVFAHITRVRDRAMFLLMYLCGLRLGEVRNLDLTGLHLEGPAPGAITRITFVGKGNRERSMFVTRLVVNALQPWLAVRPPCDCAALFVSRDRKRFSTTSIRRLLDRYCAKAGVKFSCHQLRHAFARLMAERGVPLRTLQQMMGHKSIDSTEIYIRVSDPVALNTYDAAILQIAASVPFLRDLTRGAA